MAIKLEETKVIRWIQFRDQLASPPTPVSGFGRIFAKSDGLYYIKSNGSVVGPLGSGGSGGGHTVQDEGSNLTTRSKLNFVGAGVTVTDDGVNDATIVTVPRSIIGSSEIRTILATRSFDAGSTSQDFTISQDYDAIEIELISRTQAALLSRFVNLYFNEDYTDANYYTIRFSVVIGGSNLTASYHVPYMGVSPGGSALANSYGYMKMVIPYYSIATDFHKMWNTTDQHRHSAAGGYQSTFTGYWENTNPITSIRILPASSDTFEAGSICRIFGIRYGNILVP